MRVIVQPPHTAAALVAIDRGEHTRNVDTSFHYLVTSEVVGT